MGLFRRKKDERLKMAKKMLRKQYRKAEMTRKFRNIAAILGPGFFILNLLLNVWNTQIAPRLEESSGSELRIFTMETLVAWIIGLVTGNESPDPDEVQAQFATYAAILAFLMIIFAFIYMRQMKRVKKMVRGEVEIADGLRVDASASKKKSKKEKRLSTVAAASTRASSAPRRTSPPGQSPGSTASFPPPGTNASFPPPAAAASFPPPPDWEDHAPSEDYEEEAEEWSDDQTEDSGGGEWETPDGPAESDADQDDSDAL